MPLSPTYRRSSFSARVANTVESGVLVAAGYAGVAARRSPGVARLGHARGGGLKQFEARRRRGGVGDAGYDSRMLLLLMYAYCRGVRSSRQVERLCATDVAFRVLCAQDIPDHCTLARFRADCQHAFASLFT